MIKEILLRTVNNGTESFPNLLCNFVIAAGLVTAVSITPLPAHADEKSQHPRPDILGRDLPKGHPDNYYDCIITPYAPGKDVESPSDVFQRLKTRSKSFVAV